MQVDYIIQLFITPLLLSIVSGILGLIYIYFKNFLDYIYSSFNKESVYVLEYHLNDNGLIHDPKSMSHICIDGIFFKLQQENAFKTTKSFVLQCKTKNTLYATMKDMYLNPIFSHVPTSRVQYDNMNFFLEKKVGDNKEINSFFKLTIKSTVHSQEYIVAFVESCTKSYIHILYPDEYLKKIKFYTTNKGQYKEYIFKSEKTFDNTFFNKKMDLIKILDDFENKNINKLGLLFHGLPGSGKTSCIKSIANYTKRSIIQIKLNEITRGDLMDTLFNVNLGTYQIPLSKRVYVLEDLDCDSEVSHKRNNTKPDISNDKSSISLSDVLNCLDGILELHDTIIIMTTNNVDKLDDALIRPGRIDMKIELNKMDSESMSEMIKYHFNGQNVSSKYIKEIVACQLELYIKTSKDINELEKKMETHFKKS